MYLISNRHSQGKPPAIPERYQPGAIADSSKLSTTQRYDQSLPMYTSKFDTRQDTKGYPPSSRSSFDGSNFTYHMDTQNNNSYAHAPSAYYPASQHAPEATYDQTFIETIGSLSIRHYRDRSKII